MPDVVVVVEDKRRTRTSACACATDVLLLFTRDHVLLSYILLPKHHHRYSCVLLSPSNRPGMQSAEQSLYSVASDTSARQTSRKACFYYDNGANSAGRRDLQAWSTTCPAQILREPESRHS